MSLFARSPIVVYYDIKFWEFVLNVLIIDTSQSLEGPCLHGPLAGRQTDRGWTDKQTDGETDRRWTAGQTDINKQTDRQPATDGQTDTMPTISLFL